MFAHLHLHTEYSLLDGACRIKPLMKKLKELGMESCAITDHGVMYGAVDFYREAKEAGIHPVIGCEVYVCPDMDDKTSVSREYSHLVLLCENQAGYQNLIKLVSEGFTRGFYYKPRVDYDLLAAHSEGLIALSACISGDIPKLLIEGREGDARKMAEKYISIFGRENFYIEIQDHAMAEERQALPRLVKLAEDMNLQLVATNDCHYLAREDAEAQEVLMCIQTGKTLADENRMRMNTDQLYLKSEQEMRKLFPAFPDAIDNTEIIARRCNVEFDFDTTHLPSFKLPDGEQSAGGYLRKLTEEGLKWRYAQETDELRQRVEYELGTIISMGYEDYFLTVWDFIDYARKNGIGVGPGRGSGAGSVVAYALGITGIDPLKYGLVFERLLNPERVTMPDFDIDFDYERRGEVIEYVRRRYGQDHVAQIITFGTMAARAVLRDVGRVMGMGYQQVDAIAKMVPFELNMTLERALSLSSELRRAYDTEDETRKMIDMALKLEGMPRNASTHAAGVLITAAPVVNYVPLQTNDDVVTTQFPMTTLEALGLLKMDFLGLRTLNVIMDTLDMLREGGGPDIREEDIPLDDPAIYEMISTGDTDGIFQMESEGMRRVVMGIKPEIFEDIIAIISLYRPGPMESIPKYIRGKHNPETVVYDTPHLKHILDVTYGCMVYQEQVMQIVRDLAGYSMGRSDLVRRAMAKKKHDVMLKEKEYFIHGIEEDGAITVPGAVRNGVSAEAAEKIFDEMTAFASYAFNKSHAAAYGMIVVRTAYLKKYYLPEFMAALMNSLGGNSDKIAYYIQYCRKHDIELMPPDVNLSRGKFTVETAGGKKCIRFGLAGIKNLGHGAIAALVTEREAGGAFSDIYDFISRAAGDALNKKGLESLIRAGALDSLPGKRSSKLAVYESALEGMAKSKRSMAAGQLSLFGLEEVAQSAPMPQLPDLDEFSPTTMLQMEKEVTGVYITGHPLDEYAEELSALEVNSRFLASLTDDGPDGGISMDQMTVRMGGIIIEKRMKATKSGNMMAYVQLEDLYGTTEVLVFPRVHDRISHMLAVDSVVLMTGKLSIREEEAPKLLLDGVAPLKGSGDLISGAGERQSPPSAAGSGAPSGKKLYLKLTAGRRDAVLDILRETPGNIRVMLYMQDEKKTYLAPREYWVGDGYDFGALANAIGADCVVLK